jgi:hypothetical protein
VVAGHSLRLRHTTSSLAVIPPKGRSGRAYAYRLDQKSDDRSGIFRRGASCPLYAQEQTLRR